MASKLNDATSLVITLAGANHAAPATLAERGSWVMEKGHDKIENVVDDSASFEAGARENGKQGPEGLPRSTSMRRE